MIAIADVIHYLSVVLTVTLPSLGAGLGEGIAGSAALVAINKQPAAKGEIAKNAILGMALVETAAVIGVVIAFFLLAGTIPPENHLFTCLGHLGVALAVSIPGLAIGLASSLPAREASLTLARQPFFSQQVSRFMLVSQSIIQTPIILGFIVALFINSQAASSNSLFDAVRLIAAGAAIGLGTIGPIIGLALFSRTASRGIGANREAYGSLFSFMFISNAIIESPAIFALIISLILLRHAGGNFQILDAFKMGAAALGIILGTLGPGISSGRTASAAAEQIIKKPELAGQLSKISMFAQGMIDTCAIYALLIALVMLIG